MIVIEDYRTRADGVLLKRTYSDSGKYIIQAETGVEYTEAIDPAVSNRSYIESDKTIEKQDTRREYTWVSTRP